MCRWLWQKVADNFASWESFQTWLQWQFVPKSVPTLLWKLVMFLLLGAFVKDCVEQFARAHASHKDNERLKEAALKLREAY